MSLRSRSHVKASMVLTRADYVSIHNYIGSLLKVISMLRTDIKQHRIACLSNYLACIYSIFVYT